MKLHYKCPAQAFCLEHYVCESFPMNTRKANVCVFQCVYVCVSVYVYVCVSVDKWEGNCRVLLYNESYVNNIIVLNHKSKGQKNPILVSLFLSNECENILGLGSCFYLVNVLDPGLHGR